MDNVLITVGITVYNKEEYIENCLNSIINSSDDIDVLPLEILIYNDGSTDNSKAIIEEFNSKYSNLNIKLKNAENRGVGFARNYIIENARGEYLIYLDSDDVVVDNYLDILFNTIKDKKDMYIFPYNIVDTNNKFIKSHDSFDFFGTEINNKNFSNTNLKSNKLVMFFEPALWNKIIKRDIYINNNIRMPLGIVYEDFNVFPILLLKMDSIEYIDIKIINYVYSDNSIMRNKNNRKKLDIIKSIEGILDYYKENNEYSNYKDELDYLILKHGCYIYDSIFEIDSDAPELDKLSSFLNFTLSDIMNNKYYNLESNKNKIVYLLKIKGYRRMLKFMITLKGLLINKI